MPSLAKSSGLDRQKYQEATCHRETLKWTPKHELNEQQLKQYLVLARAVSMFSKVDRADGLKDDETGNNQEPNEPATEKSGETANELNEDPDMLNKFRLIFRGLSQFVNAHHPQAGDSNCRLLRRSRSELNEDAGDDLSANSRPNADKSPDDTGPNQLSILPASEWTETECILFAAALQACGNFFILLLFRSCADSFFRPIGQNFSTIKREFLPWKNCKNIIDYYHLCLNQQSDASQTSQSGAHQTNSIEDERKKCAELRNKLDARSADGKDAKLRQCSSDINNIILDLIRANSGQNHALREDNRKSQSTVNNRDNDSNDGSPNGSFSSLGSSLPSSVTKALRTSRSNAKTNSPNEDKSGSSAKEQATEKRTSKSLKSNIDKKTSRTANRTSQNLSQASSWPKEEIGKTEPKDQYEFDDQLETECLGSLKFYKDGQLVLKLKAKQPANDNKCQWEESADSAELSKQDKKRRVESNRTREPLEQNNKQAKNADENQGDDSPFESEDSRGSSEFSLQKPLTMNGLFKKAKVKVENNYVVPLPSLASKEDEGDLESNNRKSIWPNDNKLNNDDLKRKLRTPKSGASKKSKVLKLNECTNKLNISPDLIQQQLDSFNTTPSANPLVDQLTFLSSLPLDVRQKLISDSLLKNSRLNELNGLNNLINSSVPINADNTFLENIDKIKMRNQIECLMSNLNALIEADQLK